jgi:DNA-binding NarL/FixJ family response regulator
MNNQNTSSAVQKILVIDDHVLFREGLMSLFQSAEDFKVVGGAGSVFEGIEMAYQLSPDIILMDYSMPDGTGLDATKAILTKLPQCKIVFLTVHEADEKLLEAIRAGAKGYMLKNVPSADLISALRSLGRGEMALSRRMASRIMDEFAHSVSSDGKFAQLSKLSARELEVLKELGTGASNQEIANRLFLSENTVKHHIRSILEKLGVENRHQAGLIANQYRSTNKPPEK